MNTLSKEFELLLGQAAFKLWPDLPRDMQERLFEAAVPNNPLLRYSFAYFFMTIIREQHTRLSRLTRRETCRTNSPADAHCGSRFHGGDSNYY
jgi:hypothetical protein